jgi:hypothetical protein
MFAGQAHIAIGLVDPLGHVRDQLAPAGFRQHGAVTRSPCRQRGQQFHQIARQIEGRMGSDHDAEHLALDPRPKLFERDRLVGAVRQGECADALGQSSGIDLGIDLADIAGQSVGPADEAIRRQILTELFELIIGQFAAFQPLRQLQRQCRGRR